MSSNPDSPDDTLQKMLARRRTMGDAYNVTDALSLDELNNVRKSQLDSIEKHTPTKQMLKPKKPTTNGPKNYWFNAR